MVAEQSEHSGSERAKRHRLLHALHRRGTASRLHLAKELRISNSRVCDLIEHMVEQGLLREEIGTANRQRRGRRGVSVGLNPTFGHLLGFDMEAKRLRLVVANFSGEIVWERRKALRPPKDRLDLRGPREVCAGQRTANRNHGRCPEPIRSRSPTTSRVDV